VIAASVVVGVGLAMLPGQRARMTLRSTIVAPPEGFDGLPRTGGAEVDSFLRRVAERRRWDGSLRPLAFTGGLYGNGSGETVLVLAAKAAEPLPPARQASVRQGLVATLTRSGAGLALIERDPGELGGWFGCGRRGDVTACVATDQASAVAVLVTNVTGDPAATALRAREATVHR
jgi:hypothetical protein